LTRGYKIFGKIAEVNLFSLHSFSHFSEDLHHVSDGSGLLQGEEWKRLWPASRRRMESFLSESSSTGKWRSTRS